jgi:hypothetical protein
MEIFTARNLLHPPPRFNAESWEYARPACWCQSAPPSSGVKEHCIHPTTGARVVPSRSSSIREDWFINTFRPALAFVGAAAWDKPRSIYSVALPPRLRGVNFSVLFSPNGFYLWA